MNPEIAALAADFEEWRKSKTAKTQRTPEKLWKRVRRLREKYPGANLRKLLKISSEPWKNFVVREESPPSSDNANGPRFYKISNSLENTSLSTPVPEKSLMSPALKIQIGNIQIEVFK